MTSTTPEDPRTTLLDIAARLTDVEARGASVNDWLRLFRKNYRHIAATYGLHTGYLDLDSAEKGTAAALAGGDRAE